MMCNTNKCSSDINILNRALMRHLDVDGRNADVSKKFSALKTNHDRVNFVYSLLEEYNLFPALQNDLKSNEKSLDFRLKGNVLYGQKKLDDALVCYSKSVAYASSNSEELALAYANRSAVLLNVQFHTESLQDIERCLELKTYPKSLEQKFLDRQSHITNLDVRKSAPTYHNDVPIIPEELRNKLIGCATNSVEIKFTENLGRHVLASKDIDIGEIIAIETPFCSVLIDHFTTHCYECLRLCYNLIPCPDCTQVMFCGQECLIKSQRYHKFECKILKTLRALNMDKMTLSALKIALSTREEYACQENLSLEDQETYCSNRYKEIHNLVANTEHRAVNDLLRRSTVAAVLYYTLKEFTEFFQNEEEEAAFKEIVLLHLQTSACNFHEISEISETAGVFEPREIAAGAFSFLSLFNHSCCPNIVRQCYGSTIVLRAIKSIQKGEQCYDNYGYHHAVTPKPERQTRLKEQYFFDCVCDACTKDWPLYPELPAIETDICIDSTEFSKLLNGDMACGQEVLAKVLPRMKEIETVPPNKNFSEMQEVIKQCFTIMGNMKKPLQ